MTRLAPGRLVTVPCRFDGPDLEEVAALAGCRPDDVVALLTAGPLTAAVLGFSPGFAYLEGLPSPLDRVPRRPRPRPVVPAGSVAIANGHAAVYPTASPGGWHLVGRTGFPLFSAQAPPYAALGTGGPGPLHRGRRRRARRTRAGRGTAVVLAAGRPRRLRGRGAGSAGRRAGRWAPRRRRGRCPRCGSGRSGVVRPGQPIDRERGAGGRARAHGGRDPAALPRRVPRGRGRRRARGPRRRHTGPGRAAAALGRRARCSTSVASTAGAAATCRWPAGSSGPSGSGAAPATN